MADQDGTLEKVRKLLAKAEDDGVTSPEAEALTAKAAELMAKYGIDKARLNAARPGTDLLANRKIDIENPWANVRIVLLNGIFTAMRCKAFTELAGLAASCRLCRTGPSSLGDHWLDLQQAKWWAKQPTMTCPCGTVYKMLGEPGGEQEFYPDDGGARAGFIRVNAKGKVTSSGKCPCGRAFAETIALQNARMMQYAAPVKPGKRDEPAHATAPEGALF